jgi:hypothetical protein
VTDDSATSGDVGVVVSETTRAMDRRAERCAGATRSGSIPSGYARKGSRNHGELGWFSTTAMSWTKRMQESSSRPSATARPTTTPSAKSSHVGQAGLGEVEGAGQHPGALVFGDEAAAVSQPQQVHRDRDVPGGRVLRRRLRECRACTVLEERDDQVVMRRIDGAEHGVGCGTLRTRGAAQCFQERSVLPVVRVAGVPEAGGRGVEDVLGGTDAEHPRQVVAVSFPRVHDEEFLEPRIRGVRFRRVRW